MHQTGVVQQGRPGGSPAHDRAAARREAPLVHDEAGVVLAEVSAGAICWFSAGMSNSLGPGFEPVHGLGFLPGSFCPHVPTDPERMPALKALIRPRHGEPPGARCLLDVVAPTLVRNGYCWSVFVRWRSILRRARSNSSEFFSVARLREAEAALARAEEELERAKAIEVTATERRVHWERQRDGLLELTQVMRARSPQETDVLPATPLAPPARAGGLEKTSGRSNEDEMEEMKELFRGMPVRRGAPGVLDVLLTDGSPWSIAELAEVATLRGAFDEGKDNTAATRSALKRLVAKGEVQRVGRGVYRAAPHLGGG